MALTVWDPFTALARLDSEFDDLVRRAWPSRPLPGMTTSAGFVPAVEVVRDGGDVVINLELPGVDVERDVDIEVHEGRLTISGRRAERQEFGESTTLLVRELRYGSFRREFALPEGIDADAVEASYDKGMLSVRVRNVTRPATEPRKVAIRSGDPAGPQQRTIEGTAHDVSDDKS